MDRFSVLPESHLFAIVSFLPFKEAARTSVLSKRWRHVWHSSKNIEFDERCFANVDADREVQRQVFIDFVRQWVQNYQEPTVDRLSLKFSLPQNNPRVVENCIAFALARHVKHLALDFSDPTWDVHDLDDIAHPTPFDLPLSVYNHPLESLTLSSCNFNVSEFKNFGVLKEISLCWVEMKESTTKALLAKWWCLESLSLRHCWDMDNFFCVRVGELKLKTLVVYKCRFICSYFEFEAPNLRCLRYSGTLPKFCLLENGGLDEVDLDFGHETHGNESVSDLLGQLIDEVNPMRALTVCTYMLQVLPMGEEGIGSPLGITQLTLKTTMHDYEQHGIQYFLKNCPQLETLKIEIGSHARTRIINYTEYEAPCAEVKPEHMWNQNTIIFSCVTQTLREVEMKGFRASANEIGLMSYLLCYGRVMEKLTITVSSQASGHGNPQLYRMVAEKTRDLARMAAPNLQMVVI
ncbi:hypothetical protein Pyn_18580 [Prunus yedoensis var. nudiflora]|uniref:F-box domain-containing protein n=1 Tax=Prunus yedoensis var. nudiflora TaxID=2094558 RepID=A0A314YT65_PRUYE|nr:hypothetical protein Pyn_18580 [Prunus yedoensis var. nudiflora]